MTLKPDVSDSDTDGIFAPVVPVTRLAAWLADIRANATRRRSAFAGALVVGFATTWLHWSGLILTGALVGLTRRRRSGALIAGLIVGVLAVGLTVLATPAVTADEFMRLTPVNVVTVGLAFVLPLWGSLARYVI